MLLENKVSLITGSTRGIGFAIANEFVKHGAIVILCGSREDSVNKAVDKIKEKYPEAKVSGKWPNLANYYDIEKTIQEVVDEYGRIDVVINNAGMSDDTPTTKIDVEKFDKVINLNLNSVFYGCKAAAKFMEKQNEGVIINTSSMVSKNGQPTGVSYPASKFGVNGLTVSLARELGPKGIRVNAVAPGVINTDMMRQVPEEMIAPIISAIPMQRIGEPEEIGKACVFLASDLASYVNGEILHVDGAMTV